MVCCVFAMHNQETAGVVGARQLCGQRCRPLRTALREMWKVVGHRWRHFLRLQASQRGSAACRPAGLGCCRAGPYLSEDEEEVTWVCV